MTIRKPTADKTDARDGGRRQALLLCTLALPLLIGLYALVLGYWARPQTSGTQLRLDQFLDVVAKNRVGSATILAEDDRVVGTYDGGSRYWVDFAGGHESLFARITGALEAAGVPTTVRSQPLKSLVAPVSILLPMRHPGRRDGRPGPGRQGRWPAGGLRPGGGPPGRRR